MTDSIRLDSKAGLAAVHKSIGITYLNFAGVLRSAARQATGGKESEMAPAQFNDFLKTAVENFQVSPAWLSRTYGYSKTSVSRWVSGETAPIPYMRKEIVLGMADFIAQIGEEKAREVSENANAASGVSTGD